MNREIIEKLRKEIAYQNEQFDLLYNEHFSSERFMDSVYLDMIKNVNKSKGKIEVLMELLLLSE
tara:strand:- start:28 stop:219 length:192 start_codon:yes stop_codon:yes gene_type:complete